MGDSGSSKGTRGTQTMPCGARHCLSAFPIGTSVLFVFALGMGVLMIALGTFSGALAAMPRSWLWMFRVKKAFGVIMIIVAEYLLLQAGQRFI